MSFYWLLLGVLAVWRVTHLVHAEDGPWDIVVRLRRLAGTSVVGQAMDCFYCLSLWFSLPAAALIGQGLKEIGLLWLALSAGAILLERLTDRQAPAPAAAVYYDEEPGGKDDVLRKEEGGAHDGGRDEPR
jgi:hypothetical protein